MIRDFPDLHFSVTAAANENSVAFVVHDLKSDIHTEVIFEGNVNNDGCSNWYFDDLVHCCNRSQLTRIGEAMARCWDWAKELLPGFYGEIEL